MSSLYLDHFGLSKPPFQITPDLDFFFSGGRRGDILSALLHVAGHEEGIITVVAEVGSGKTLLARLMISRLAPNINTVYLANPSFSRDEILGAIARDLGLKDLPNSTEARLAALQEELLRRHALGLRVLLVIDEAHAMPPESLEEVRLLSNLETGQHKLVNILLFGQPELDELLADRRLRQVRDRIVHRFNLTPLPEQDVSAYVDHRLRAAGWKGGALFAAPALALLIKASGGRARRINLLADKALLSAYALGQSTVQVRQVQDAIGELHDDFSDTKSGVPHWVKWAVLSVVLAVVMTALTVWFLESQRTQRLMAATATETANVAQATAPVPVPAPLVQPALPAPAASAAPAAQRDPVAVVQPAAAAASTPPEVVAAPVGVRPTGAEPSTATATAAAAAAAAAAVASPPLMSAASLAAVQPYLQRTQAYFQKPDLGGYTVQLVALSPDGNVAEYLKFLTQHVDAAMVFAQLTHYNGRDYVSVFVGQYANAAQAHAALAGWPGSIKTNKPMVRTWIKIRQDQSS
jgi:MSHA biogenesis protein MshM